MTEATNKTPGKTGKASNAGNLASWNAQGHRYPEIERAVEKFKADLDALPGESCSPARVAMSAAAVANYTAILLVQKRLLASRGRYSKIEALLGQLPTLTGSLLRTLRLLGIANGPTDDDDNVPPGGGLAAWTEEWRKRQQVTPAAESGPAEAQS